MLACAFTAGADLEIVGKDVFAAATRLKLRTEGTPPKAAKMGVMFTKTLAIFNQSFLYQCIIRPVAVNYWIESYVPELHPSQPQSRFFLRILVAVWLFLCPP